eukprot:TRINITY_DN9340_c0_g1_i1.p1 TRINITY_DN9340_c0_g1~~TRINITY_DN9340_c0_g1_i1.p1  ORF type:complete len:410 (-),score=61.96 TRINITY_DN9340_c0_g1_i1:269-1498(-)
MGSPLALTPRQGILYAINDMSSWSSGSYPTTTVYISRSRQYYTAQQLRAIGVPIAEATVPWTLSRNIAGRTRRADVAGAPNAARHEPAATSAINPTRFRIAAEAMAAMAVDELTDVAQRLQESSLPHGDKLRRLTAKLPAVERQSWTASAFMQLQKEVSSLSSQLRCSPKAPGFSDVLLERARDLERAACKLSPRILCLHGSTQCGQVFQSKLKMLDKRLRQRLVARLSFIDAPHLCDDEEADSPSRDTARRCWWKRGAQRGQPHPDWAAQWTASRQVLWQALRAAEDEGDAFAGILGFSNGAAAAAILLTSLLENDAPSPVKFAIFCAGYLPNAIADGSTKLAVPSLHVIGSADEQISLPQARQLQELFQGNYAKEFLHEQGHQVPQRANDCDAFIDFIQRHAEVPLS